jgi:hypothetical protein
MRILTSVLSCFMLASCGQESEEHNPKIEGFHAKIVNRSETFTFKGSGQLVPPTDRSTNFATNGLYFDSGWNGIDTPPRPKDSLYKIGPIH